MTGNLKALFQFDQVEMDLMRKTLPQIDLEKIIASFYAQFTTHPVTAPFFKSQDVRRLKSQQVKHWQNLMQNGPSDAFLSQTRVIGDIHEKIGVTPEIYLAGYSFVFGELLDDIFPQLSKLKKDQRKQLTGVIIKLLMADIAASLSAYVAKSGESTAFETTQKVTGELLDDAVDISMAINHVFVDGLKANHMSSEVDQQIGSISAAIEQMNATVSTITNSTQQANEYANKTAGSTQEGLRISDQAMESMNRIQASVNETTDKSRQLEESSQKIEDIITKIQGIADQTNLLALNATIEAARAGDAGKGFAVVANEVKSLSNETTKATEEISEIISQFVGSIREIVTSMQEVVEVVRSGQETTSLVQGSMQEIEEHAGQVSTLMDEIAKALVEQNQASVEIANVTNTILTNAGKNKEMSKRNSELSQKANDKVASMIGKITEIGGTDSKIIIKLAKSDHIIWKRKLAEILLGDAALNEEELKDHTQCRLGKWYYAAGKEQFGTVQAYQALEDPHARIHRTGLDACRLYKHKRYEEALERLDEMEEISHEVIDLLNELDKLAA